MQSARTLLLTVLVLPFVACAQTDDLRAQIRADILQDPRASQMSQVELENLIDALAVQAIKDGTADQYLESHNTFDYSSLFPEPKAPNPLVSFLTSPLALALLALSMPIGCRRAGEAVVPGNVVACTAAVWCSPVKNTSWLP